MPEEAEQEIAQLPADARQALDTVVDNAYIGTFRGTRGVLVAALLAALAMASFVPRVETEEVPEPEITEAAADVSSRLM